MSTVNVGKISWYKYDI